jgi:hypothetical protein
MNTDPDSVVFYGLWMLSAMGAVVFASMPASLRSRVSGLALGITAAVLLRSRPLADVGATGAVTAAVAVAQLLRPNTAGLPIVVMTAAGALAGTWSTLLAAQGFSRALSTAAALALPIAVAILTIRRPTFAPERLRDESLVIVLALGLGLATAPAVLGGWQAAASLNAPQPAQAVALPAWTLATVVGTCAAGGLYTWWIRR